MNSYVCRGCHKPACVEDHKATDYSPAYQDIVCLTPGCLLEGVVTDSRNEAGLANRFLMPTPPVIEPTIRHPAAPFMRVSERPGSIPCTLEDLENPETIEKLKQVLNVRGFVDELRQIALE